MSCGPDSTKGVSPVQGSYCVQESSPSSILYFVQLSLYVQYNSLVQSEPLYHNVEGSFRKDRPF